MAREGFIHDELDLKILVLYLLDRLEYPVNLDELTDLSMCDGGVGYFELTQAIDELVKTGHVTHTDGKYAITNTGRRDSRICQDQLAVSVRRKCDRNLNAENQKLREAAEAEAHVLAQPDGSFIVQPYLREKQAVLMSLELNCPTEEQAKDIVNAFRENAHQAYRKVLIAFSGGKEEKQ